MADHCTDAECIKHAQQYHGASPTAVPTDALVRRLRLAAAGEYGGGPDIQLLCAQAAGLLDRDEGFPRGAREWSDGTGQLHADPVADDLFDLVHLLTHDVPCGSFDHAEKIIAAGYRRTPPPIPVSADAVIEACKTWFRASRQSNSEEEAAMRNAVEAAIRYDAREGTDARHSVPVAEKDEVSEVASLLSPSDAHANEAVRWQQKFMAETLYSNGLAKLLRDNGIEPPLNPGGPA